MTIYVQKKVYQTTLTKKIRRVRNQGVIGSLKNRIDLVERVNIHTDNGSGPYLKADFNVVFSCWANHLKREGVQIFNDVNIKEDFSDIFVIRARPERISSKLFIRFNKEIYNIQDVLEYDDDWWLFRCNKLGSEEKQANRR